MVFNVGDDALDARRHRILLIFYVVAGRLIAGPPATFHVQHIAGLILVTASSPAEIHTPQCCRVAIGERCEHRTIFGSECCLAGGQDTAAIGEADAALDLVAEAKALLFIRVDAVAAAGCDVLHPK